MAKKSKQSDTLTKSERTGGLILFVIYLLVMPLLLERIYAAVGTLLDTEISKTPGDTLYCCLLFAAALLLFRRFIGKDISLFFSDLNRSFSTVGMALLFFYGANELFFRLCRRFVANVTDLNDIPIIAQTEHTPASALMLLLIVPYVEELLFRGLVFGWLAPKSRAVAYVASALLFAFGHVFVFFANGMGTVYLAVMLQYLIPGFVFAWACQRGGSVAASFLVHAAVNALAFISMA